MLKIEKKNKYDNIFIIDEIIEFKLNKKGPFPIILKKYKNT